MNLVNILVSNPDLTLAFVLIAIALGVLGTVIILINIKKKG
ncbi:MAG: hypothetical protein QXX95_04860 [Nitrososphaerales archaeon]